MSQLYELQLFSLQTISAPTVGAGVAVSAITGDYTLHVRVVSLAAGANLRVAIEECANNFSGTAINMQSFSTTGPIGGLPQQADQVYSFRARELSGDLFGVAGAYARANVTVDSGSATLEVWVSYSA